MFAHCEPQQSSMAQRTIETTRPNALDDFLPERVFNLGVRGDGEQAISIMEQLSPDDLRLDPIEHLHHPATVGGNPVQLWPMLAAGFVALGVTLLVLTIFAKYLDRLV